MSEELHDLKTLLDDATPPPNAQRRAANIALAQESFAQLHGAAKAVPAQSFWTQGKAWIGGAAASLTVVAAAVALMLPASLPKPPGPIALESNHLTQESLADVAIATLETPESISRSAPAPPAAAEMGVQTRSADASFAADTLSFAAVADMLQTGRLPNPADVTVSSMLAGIADAGLTEQTTAMPVPWDGSRYFVLDVSSDLANQNDAWQLLGTHQQGAQRIAVYLADTPVGARADADTRLAAAVTGFALLLGGALPSDDWSFDAAIALIQDSAEIDPSRARLVGLITHARDRAH